MDSCICVQEELRYEGSTYIKKEEKKKLRALGDERYRVGGQNGWRKVAARGQVSKELGGSAAGASRRVAHIGRRRRGGATIHGASLFHLTKINI